MKKTLLFATVCTLLIGGCASKTTPSNAETVATNPDQTYILTLQFIKYKSNILKPVPSQKDIENELQTKNPETLFFKYGRMIENYTTTLPNYKINQIKLFAEEKTNDYAFGNRGIRGKVMIKQKDDVFILDTAVTNSYFVQNVVMDEKFPPILKTKHFRTHSEIKPNTVTLISSKAERENSGVISSFIVFKMTSIDKPLDTIQSTEKSTKK